MAKRKVLITGAAGTLGSYLARAWSDRYDLRISIRKTRPDYKIAADTELITLDISDLDAVRDATRGIDTVVHCAATPHPTAPFYDDILDKNIKGVYNIFHAAQENGCRRVVNSSSVMIMVGNPNGTCVTPEMPPNPTDLYGASKVFGEAIGRAFHNAHGLSSYHIRYGSITDNDYYPETPGNAAWYISLRDCEQLARLCVEADEPGYAVVNGFSRHRECRFDIGYTCELLGYEPHDGTAMQRD